MSKKDINNRLESLFSDLVPEFPSRQEVADQSLPGWTWECDGHGNYVSCSPEVENVLGLRPEDFIGQPFTSFRLAPESAEALQSTLDTGKYPLNLDVQYQTRDGEMIPVSLHVFKAPPSGGHRWGGFAQALFVTKRDASTSHLKQSISDLSPPKLIEDNRLQPFKIGEVRVSLDEEENKQNGNNKIRIGALAGVSEDKPKPADHILAGQKIIEILESIRVNSSDVNQFEYSQIQANQKEEFKEDRTQRPIVTGSLSGIETRSYPKIVVQEIEHKLEWGRKLGLTPEDEAYLENHRYSPRGLSGIFQRRRAPKEILKHDKFWIAVCIVLEKGKSKRLRINYQRDKDGNDGIDLKEFLRDPDILMPKLVKALSNPFSSRATLHIGEDYLISR